VAFLMQLIAYTSSRPGSIVEANCYKGLGQVLKYRILVMFRFESISRNNLAIISEGCNNLVLELTTTSLKGKRNKCDP
jgi:hypothetical protein